MTNDEIQTAFAELRRCTSDLEILTWIHRNSAALYANARNVISREGIPAEPSWHFKTVTLSQLNVIGDKRLHAMLEMTIAGNDPYGTIRRMFENSGITLVSMHLGADKFRAQILLTSDEFGPFFVHRKLSQE